MTYSGTRFCLRKRFAHFWFVSVPTSNKAQWVSCGTLLDRFSTKSHGFVLKKRMVSMYCRYGVQFKGKIQTCPLTYSEGRTGRQTTPLCFHTSLACTPPSSSVYGNTDSGRQKRER